MSDECTGDVGCTASPHFHGCHSDYGDCEAPFDHPAAAALRAGAGTRRRTKRSLPTDEWKT